MLSTSLAAAGGCLRKGSPIQLITLSPDSKHYTLVLRDEEETENCLLLDGLVVGGRALRLTRPPGQPPGQPPARPSPSLDFSKLIIKKIHPRADTGEARLFLGNISPACPQDVLLELLAEHGFLKSFHLAYNRQNTGFAYFSYYAPEAGRECLDKLNGSLFYGQHLVAKAAPFQTDDNLEPRQRSPASLAPQEQAEERFLTAGLRVAPGCCLHLQGLLLALEVQDIDRATKEVLRQLERVGRVVRLWVDEAGEGLVAQFASRELATIAALLVEGRRFNGRAVKA